LKTAVGKRGVAVFSIDIGSQGGNWKIKRPAVATHRKRDIRKPQRGPKIKKGGRRKEKKKGRGGEGADELLCAPAAKGKEVRRAANDQQGTDNRQTKRKQSVRTSKQVNPQVTQRVEKRGNYPSNKKKGIGPRKLKTGMGCEKW